jgi:hypothetical protein
MNPVSPKFTNLDYGSQSAPSSAVPSQQIQPQPQASAPVKQPSWWERLLPTAGGILGGIVGIPGDIFGGAGSIVGAGAGGALGQEIENKLTGQNNNPLVAGAENAAGAGIGSALGGVVEKVLPSISSKLGNVGADLIQGQAAKGFLSDAESQQLQDMGITDLRQVPQIFNHVSGANGALPNTVKDVLSNSEGVDITGLDRTANDLAAQNGVLDPSPIRHINNALNTAINNSVPGSVEALPTKGTTAVFSYEPGALKNALPENVFQQTQQLEKLANSAYQKGFDPYTKAVTDPTQAGLYKVYKGMADHMETAAFGGTTPTALTDESKASLIDQLSPLKDINAKAYNSYVTQIGQAQNLQDLRPIQSLIVRANNAVTGSATKAGQQAGMNATDVAKSVGAPLSLALNHPVVAAGSLAVSSDAANRVGADAFTKLSDAVGSSTAQKILPILTRIGTIATSNLPNIAGSAVQSNSAIPTGVNPMNSNVTATGTFAQNPLDQLYNEIIAQSQSPTGISGNLVSTANTLAPLVQKQALAAPVLSNLLSAYGNAGGAQGMGGGFISKLSGLIPGTAANTFNAQLGAAAAQLAQLLGISPEQAAQMLPGLMQNAQSAAPQVGGIQSILGSITAPNQGLPSAIPAQ